MKLLHLCAMASLALICMAPPVDAGSDHNTTTGSGLGEEDDPVDGAEIGSGATAAIDDTAPVETAADHAGEQEQGSDAEDDDAAPEDDDDDE